MINTTTLEALWNNGLVDREIAKKLNCSHSTVFVWRKRNGLPSNAGIFNWDNGEHSEDERDYRKAVKV